MQRSRTQKSARLMMLGLSTILATSMVVGEPAKAGPADNTLVWASGVPPLTVDPYFALDREINMVTAQLVFDGLVYIHPETQKFEPLLAKSWKWVDDTTLSFELRNDVTFHDGTRFTSADVVATLNYVSNPKNGAANQQNVNWIKTVEANGDHAVTIRLHKPFPAALDYLAQLLPIFQKDAYTTNADAPPAKRFVGTGPYRFSEFVSGASITILPAEKRLMNSPKGDPKFVQIKYRGLPDQATQVAELLSGNVDWIWRVSPDMGGQLSKSPALSVINAESMRVSMLSYNIRDKAGKNPLQDSRVREAIAIAINRKAIVDNVVGQGGEVIDTPCYKTQFGCNTKVPHRAFDQAKAKKLLAEAGYATGLKLSFIGWRNKEWLEIIASQLGEVGIKVDAQFMQNSAGRQLIQDNKAELVHQDWGSYSINDVSAIYNPFFTGGPDDITRDAEVTKLVNEGGATSNSAKRIDYYNTVENRILNQFFWVPLWSHPTSYAFNKKLKFNAFADENPRFFLSSWSK